jgi:hypothetical protein
LAAAENVQVPFISRRIRLGLLSPKIRLEQGGGVTTRTCRKLCKTALS